MSKIKSPQEKKKLSYARDCRDAYGESDKGSRKSIRKNKRLSSQAERSVELRLKQIISHELDDGFSTEVENDVTSTGKLKRCKGFRKYPDQPLMSYIKQQKEKRITRAGRKINAKSLRCQ